MASPFQHDLKTGWPNLDVIPKGRLSEIAADVIVSDRGTQYTSDRLMGKLTVRDEVAKFLTATFDTYHSVTAENIMIATGALTAIDIVNRALSEPNDLVLVEDPTFFFVVNILKMSRVEVKGIPMRHDGIDLNMIEDIAKANPNRLKLVYSIPSYHNPTGYCASLENRQGLIALADKYGFKILEDSTYQGLYFDQPPPPMIRTLDTSGEHVISVGSISKIIMPALRVGWIWAETPFMPAFLQYKSDSVSSGFTSEIVADFLKEDSLYGQMENARQFYASKYKIAVDVLSENLPEWVTWTPPNGGFFFWLEMPESVNIDELVKLANEHDVDFLPGPRAASGDRHLNAIRVCFAYLDDEPLAQAMHALCEVLHSYPMG